MSRVGKHPVSLPAGVSAAFEGSKINVKGRLGALSFAVPAEVDVRVENAQIAIAPRDDSNRARMLWGTVRNTIQNMVTGVSAGFNTTLEIEGVGFRAAMQGADLVLQLGFSHEVRYAVPEGVTIKAEKPTVINIAGADRQQVGQVAAEIRGFKRPEPYKGKGIRYAGEAVRRKEGKKK